MRFAPLVVVSALCVPLMGFDCAQGIQPLYTSATIVVDDTVVGEYASIAPQGSNLTHLKIEKATTGLPSSYLVQRWEEKTPKNNEGFRIVFTDIGGQRYVDLIVEPQTPEEKKYASGASIPVHIYLKIEGTPVGFNLFRLDNKFLDAAGAKNPALGVTINGSTLLGLDTAGLRSLHEGGIAEKAFTTDSVYARIGTAGKPASPAPAATK